MCNMRAASAVRELAAQKGAPPGQVALAWLLHKGDDIVPTPGTKRRTYLEENLGAATLDTALPPGTVAGPRYTERLMAMVDR